MSLLKDLVQMQSNRSESCVLQIRWMHSINTTRRQQFQIHTYYQVLTSQISIPAVTIIIKKTATHFAREVAAPKPSVAPVHVTLSHAVAG